MSSENRNILAGFCGVLGGLLFACLLGLHMHNQAADKNARIGRWDGPALHGVVVAVSKPRKQTFVSPGRWGGTGLATEWQKTATLHYTSASGKAKTLAIFPANGLVKGKVLNFYIKPDGRITTESGKEPPKSIWGNIAVECCLLGAIVAIVVGGISALLLERPWRPQPTLHITG